MVKNIFDKMIFLFNYEFSPLFSDTISKASHMKEKGTLLSHSKGASTFGS